MGQRDKRRVKVEERIERSGQIYSGICLARSHLPLKGDVLGFATVDSMDNRFPSDQACRTLEHAVCYVYDLER